MGGVGALAHRRMAQVMMGAEGCAAKGGTDDGTENGPRQRGAEVLSQRLPDLRVAERGLELGFLLRGQVGGHQWFR
jgi:hypothetical protein